MKPSVKVFDVPYWELSTEGIGIDNEKMEYTFDCLFKEAQKEIKAFKNKEIDTCWHGVTSTAVKVLPKAITSTKDPFEMADMVCDTAEGKYDCDDISELVNNNFDEDDFYDYDDEGNITAIKGTEKACIVDAFYSGEEDRIFSYHSFDFEEVKGKDKDEFLGGITHYEKELLADEKYGALVIRGCTGNNGELLSFYDDYAEDINDTIIKDLFNFHNVSTSPQCMNPIVALQDGTVWRGDKLRRERL